MRRKPATIRLAVIDADDAFVRVLGNRLAAAGWEHHLLADGRIEELRALKLNALLLDPVSLSSPVWCFLEAIAAELPGLAVIVCSTDSTVAQRVRGLRLGADDWVAKPCHPEEVVARVESVVRRRAAGVQEGEPTRLAAGELEIRVDRFDGYVRGDALKLTPREFELLLVFAHREGQVIARHEIYERVWGYAMAHGDRSVDVFVRKLRSKLRRYSAGWRYIHTHFGVGYRFEAVPENLEASPSSGPVPQAASRAEANAAELAR
jgi:DNA-binding response OmpR family regulator